VFAEEVGGFKLAGFISCVKRCQSLLWTWHNFRTHTSAPLPISSSATSCRCSIIGSEWVDSVSAFFYRFFKKER
jgi:hypothetical protein